MDLATTAQSTHQDEVHLTRIVHLARVGLYSPAWPELGLCSYARLDMMRLVSYPGVLDQCLSFTGAAKLTRASFLVLVLQVAKLCWGKNGQGKSLGDNA